jgi:hypothetical protein
VTGDFVHLDVIWIGRRVICKWSILCPFLAEEREEGEKEEEDEIVGRKVRGKE